MIICKICGGRVSDEVACCARCFTPHHFDCWGFFGQCSIFACGCKDHRYFDFREKSEAEVLAAIGQSLAVALKEEPARPREDAAQETKKSADDLLAYKRGLFRSLHAVLQKVAPGSVQESSELIGSFEAEVDGKDVPRLFLADDLDIDADAGRGPAMDEKKRLLHALAKSNLPEAPKPWLERFKEWLKELLGG